MPLCDAGCKFCTTCVEVCPSGALVDAASFEEKDRDKTLLPCSNTCPAQIDISRYVRLISLGRFQDALEVVREKVPFPEVLGYVCDHPCEGACRRGQVNESMSVKALKRFVAQRDTGRWRARIAIAPPTGKKVAIVGSGPAGLTAAWFLGKSGHSVTVFEALEQAGGMLRIGIPAYRLPREILDREIGEIVNIGVQIRTNARIESLDKLFADGFHAVFVALGAMKGAAMGIPGEDEARVLDGISALMAINLGNAVDISGHVAVIGGGNVAIDVARSALRMGAEKVTILYRRTRDEMPAEEEEIEEAINEGVEIRFLVAPQEVSPTADKLHIRCIKMELGEPDSSGRRRPVPVRGSEFIIEADRLITAIGQKTVVPTEFASLINGKGLIGADSAAMSCPRNGVFAGGDVVSGPASVIKAIEAGRKAAASIDRYLGGTGVIDQQLVPAEDASPCLGREDGFARRERARMPTLSLEQRRRNFACIELGFDEKTAIEEAQRCLRCEMRLRLSKAPLPPGKRI
jgi:NADPH-dependent glutamate synthase beta subunit-like oxidoreductase